MITGATAMMMCVLAALWIRHRLRRRLRITPAARSTAPTLWLVSPTAAAWLHHRLRRVGASAHAASTLDPALTDLANELVADAVSLEPAVVAVAGTVDHDDPPGTVGPGLRIFSSPPGSSPCSSVRAATGPVRRFACTTGSMLSAAARQELADIEAASGLRTPA